MKNKKVYIGCDPGYVGGISILEGRKKPKVYHIPVIKTKKKLPKGKIKTKTQYDYDAIIDILKPYMGKDVVFALERVSSRPGEGSVSSFNFGTGWGSLIGMAKALGFKLEIVSPVSWKKHFPELETTDMQNFRKSIALLKKDKGSEKLNKKEIENMKRSIKSLAKNRARELASILYPKLSSEFEKKNDDGVAESLLIALYARSKW